MLKMTKNIGAMLPGSKLQYTLKDNVKPRLVSVLYKRLSQHQEESSVQAHARRKARLRRPRSK